MHAEIWWYSKPQEFKQVGFTVKKMNQKQSKKSNQKYNIECKYLKKEKKISKAKNLSFHFRKLEKFLK